MPDLKLYRTASTSSGQRISVGNTLAVDQEVTRDGTTLYQRKVFLAIPSDPHAHSISLKNKLMVGRFEKKLLTIRRTSNYLAESWKKKDDHVVVKFKRPWHLNRINTVNPSFVSLFRVDGDAIADEATLQVVSNQTLVDEFVGLELAAKITGSITSFMFMAFAGAGGAGSKGAAKSMKHSQGAGTAKEKRVGKGDDIHLTFDRGLLGINSVVVNSYPTTPRMMLPVDISQSSVAEEDPVDLVWQEAGELRDAVPADVGDALSNLITAKASGLVDNPPATGNHWFVPVLIESDVPCEWTLEQFDFSANFVIDRFQNDESEHQMVFEGSQIQPKPLPLEFPVGNILSASLKIDIANQGNMQIPGQLNVQNHHIGLAVNEQYWAASKIPLSPAGFYNAISLFLAMYSPEAALTISIVPGDLAVNGAPLAEMQMKLGKIGQKAWYTLPMDELRLDSGDYWLILKAAKGSLIWLGTAKPDHRALRGDNNSPGQPASPVKDIQPHAAFLSADTSAEANNQLFQLQANGTAINLQEASDNVYTLALPSSFSSSSKISVTQASKGLLKFTQPYIEYE